MLNQFKAIYTNLFPSKMFVNVFYIKVVLHIQHKRTCNPLLWYIYYIYISNLSFEFCGNDLRARGITWYPYYISIEWILYLQPRTRDIPLLCTFIVFTIEIDSCIIIFNISVKSLNNFLLNVLNGIGNLH